MIRVSIVLLLFCLSSCVAEQPERYKITIDLQNPSDLSGLPSDEKWNKMGDYVFCAIQGVVDARIKLPSGTFIEDQFGIVYVDRDDEGIFRVRGDSFSYVDLSDAESRLDRELNSLVPDPEERAKLSQTRSDVIEWLKTPFYEKEHYMGFHTKNKDWFVSFRYFRTFRSKPHPHFTYNAMFERSKQRRDRNRELMQNKSVEPTS